MPDLIEGSVVIVADKMQAGTLIHVDTGNAWVLLACTEIWVGPKRNIRIPQDQADLDSCVLIADRFEGR